MHVDLVSGGREALRLHLWRHTLASEPRWPVHTHSYGLTSLVVAGWLADRRFEVVPDPNGHNQLYGLRYGESGSKRIKLAQRVRCVEVGRFVRTTNETYRVPVDTFHSSLLAGHWPAAVTVVRTGRSTKICPRVVGAVDGAEVYGYERRAVDGDALDEWSRFIIDELRLH